MTNTSPYLVSKNIIPKVKANTWERLWAKKFLGLWNFKLHEMFFFIFSQLTLMLTIFSYLILIFFQSNTIYLWSPLYWRINNYYKIFTYYIIDLRVKKQLLKIRGLPNCGFFFLGELARFHPVKQLRFSVALILRLHLHHHHREDPR